MILVQHQGKVIPMPTEAIVGAIFAVLTDRQKQQILDGALRAEGKVPTIFIGKNLIVDPNGPQPR